MGSKRVCGKNRLRIGERTLLERTMDAVAQSGVIERTILSTDDMQLISAAEQYPDMECDARPVELAADQTSSADVLRYLIQKLGLETCTIILLQLTSPFRTGADISALLERMAENNVESGVSVTRWRTPPSPPFGTTETRTRLGSEQTTKGSEQTDLRDRSWAINGAVYIFKATKLLREGALYDPQSAIHIMEPWRSIDIDYEDDVKIAEAIARHYNL